MGTGKPTSLALIICDAVIDDRETHKKTLVGIFNNVNAEKVPFRHPELHVFISLTDGNGAYRARLECRHRQSNEKVFELMGDIKFEDPNQVIELNFAICRQFKLITNIITVDFSTRPASATGGWKHS